MKDIESKVAELMRFAGFFATATAHASSAAGLAEAAKARKSLKSALRTALESASRLPDGWQPIETAPLGTSVLLVAAGTNIPIYCGRKRHGRFGEPQQNLFAWRCDSSGRYATPTHWMPLPAQPIAARPEVPHGNL